MRLHVLSDLHLEFGSLEIPDTDAEVVVFAGDVSTGPRGFDWIKNRFPGRPVVYVLGNHEFYHHNLPRLWQTLQREAEGSHIHVLENSSVELGGFKFLGCTLWTDFALKPDSQRAMARAEDRMNDYRVIRFGDANSVLRARDTVDIHRESVAWLRRELTRSNPERTIVIAHHAPSPRSETPGNTGSPLSPAFVSELSQLVEESRIPLWVHGHTHHNVAYRLGLVLVCPREHFFIGNARLKFSDIENFVSFQPLWASAPKTAVCEANREDRR